MVNKMINKVEIIRKETIKPSSPTPSHLKSYKLSVLDQLGPPVYCRMVYFYTNNDATNTTSTSNEQKSQQLKRSLSESLARFYPIAGRVNNNTAIECNDEGAEYVEARNHGLLSTFLEQPADLEALEEFLPAAVVSPEAGLWPLFLVQVTFFDCGGLAIGACMSHKIADATTISIFMKSWAATSRSSTGRSGDQAVLMPVLNAESYFPQRDLSLFQLLPAVEFKKAEYVTKRFVFGKQKMMDLKAKIGGETTTTTRVQSVTGLIWKCVIAASLYSKSGRVPKKFVLSQAMNIRKRADPPLPENLIGNVVSIFAVQTDEQKPTLEHLVAELRKGIIEFTERRAKRLRQDDASKVIFEDLKEAGELMGRDTSEGLIVTSLCNFQLYEAVDFGWGKPVWATAPLTVGHDNFVSLMDTKDAGGIEAWVTLSKEDMDSFQRNPEILEFARP
ncbi:Transferase [Trema orientale]|uniref:Transferase n=1 Tax=Trema orientale TaxID=63057 RepID=A0A2P5FQY9_TREOI|nr:Transferase [Trema orientale]